MTSQTRVTFHLPFPAFALAMLCALTVIATRPAQAQTFSVLHYFTGGSDEGNPRTGVTVAAAGTLYGTAGGAKSAWYSFQAHPEGFRLDPRPAA